MQPPKKQAYAELARIGGALSNDVRLEILELLAQSERNVDELARLAQVSVANASQHLQKLRQAGLIVGRKHGLFVYYRLAGERVAELLSTLARVAEAHNAEIERIVRSYYLSRDDFEPVEPTELLERVRRGLVVVLDVRPVEEYNAGHIPGAVNIPLGELAKRIRELPKRKEVIAYCRGPFCLMSFQAVELLRKRGWTARRLKDGLPEWRSEGRPVSVVDAPARA
jgi:rhodanese-related sulfurtransferase/DNA-binding MarR family transcriptional regulator